MRRIVGVFLLLMLIIVGINAYVIISSWNAVISPDYEGYNIGLVLGASVRSDRSLSPILQQRVDAAISAYDFGRIDQILVSGYDKDTQYLEAVSMSDYLLRKGVSDEDIIIDSGGYDTLASMDRVATEFNITKIIIFTQRYHLRRAVMLARAQGIDAVGYAVDPWLFSWRDLGTSREILARVKATGEIILR